MSQQQQTDWEAKYNALVTQNQRNEQLKTIATDTGMSKSALQRLDATTPGVQYAKKGEVWHATHNGQEATLDAFVKSEWAEFEAVLYPEGGPDTPPADETLPYVQQKSANGTAPLPVASLLNGARYGAPIPTSTQETPRPVATGMNHPSRFGAPVNGTNGRRG